MGLFDKLRKTYILVCLLLITIFNAQAYTIHEIDSLQTSYDTKLYYAGDYPAMLSLAKKTIKRSKELHYIKGETRGYISLANIFCILNRNKESFYFLGLAEKKLQESRISVLETRLNLIYGRNYYALGLYKQAIERFNRAGKIAYSIDKKKERDQRLYYVYDWKRTTFNKMNMLDSAQAMENKCLRMPEFNRSIYVALAEKNIKNKKLDSAEFYLKKATMLSKKGVLEGRAEILQVFGIFYNEKNENEKALEYFFESLKVSEKLKLKRKSSETYKIISATYRKLNNIEKENEFLIKYSVLNDSLNQVEKNILSVPVEKFLNERTESENKSKRYLYYFIAGIILTVIISSIAIYRICKEIQERKDLLIDQKERETEILKKKLSTVYEEVIELAKKNDVSFLIRFNEAYPEFSKKLLSRYPDLTSNDIRFCALLRLDFSNKEIAQYGSMSIRTVESKKYRLRKKLGLTSDVDLNKWMSTL